MTTVSRSHRSHLRLRKTREALLACLHSSAVALVLLLLPHPAPAAPATATQISLAEYRLRLQALDGLVAACQSTPGPANCHSDQVGPDLEVSLQTTPADSAAADPGNSPRRVRLQWLRALLEEALTAAGTKGPNAPRAADKQGTSSTPSPVDNPQEPLAPTLLQQLADARERLAKEMQQADRLASPPPSNQPATSSSTPSSARRTLASILAAKEFHPAVVPPSLWQRFLEKAGNWINRFFAKLAEAGASSRWFGYAAEIAFGMLVCVAIAWFLIRLERQGRLDPNSIATGPGSTTASARDWQLWLDDARHAAAQGAWRDAIRLTYWASISRLESVGQWPADRARTPREYLALLSPESAERASLAAITRSFERTWYAGRPAQEADFRQAEEIAAKLGAGQRQKSRAR